MLYRPTVRSSRAALWSRRFGGFAVPLLVLTVIAHRADMVQSIPALILGILITGLGALALVLALIGYEVVWERGFRGAGNATAGFVYALIALAPLAYGAYATATYPNISDISTDPTDPPLYRQAAFIRAGRMNSVELPSPAKVQLQQLAYPDLATRHFGLGSDQLFGAALKVAEKNGWAVLDLVRPKDDGDFGRIEATTRAPVLGARSDVVVRILGEASGARIDIRSASRFGSHDLGHNAALIRRFFTDLDAAVTESFGQ